MTPYKSKKQRLNEWINVPAKLFAPELGRTIEGTIKYGFRLPMKPGDTPLLELPTNCRGRYEGQSPAYWFVSENQDTKVRLLFLPFTKVSDDEIRGRGYDSGLAKIVIRRKR